ncbi:hypothetical protein [Aestuariivirga sp.]|jgi:hypothetical protein|uniref:hypothetical protein n=1 Tax=Aestuariivirga sp. TaxID=2650926 RepID=UPI003783C15C
MFRGLTAKRRKKKRRYIPRRLGVERFFKALKDESIDYVVLRWFDSLPTLAQGEDIDLLVADEDLERIERHLNGSRRNGTPVDLYTVSGLPGTDYRGVPYFPPPLAREVLATAGFQSNGVRVPDTWHHLSTMCYHALFHKGFDCGLPEGPGLQSKVTRADHDYAAAIGDCARSTNVVMDNLTLDGIRKWLDQVGWQPPMDTLEKLARRNAWVREAFFPQEDLSHSDWDGLAVFVVRDRGLSSLPQIRDALWREGFDMLDEGAIPPELREQAKYQIRGGNWHRGPWPESGGDPAYIIVTFDVFPVNPNPKLQASHFGLTNERIYKAKRRARDIINNALPSTNRCNAIHSSDNSSQALHYLKVAWNDPGREASLEAKIGELKQKVDFGHEVIMPLSRYARRAAAWLIRYNGKLAVCKVFRPGRERFMHRERKARELAGSLPYILPIIGEGERWLIFPYLADLDTGKRFLTRREMAIVREIILHFRRAGFELIDFTPGNLLIDTRQGLRANDFEFMQQAMPSGSLKGCYCWYRVRDSSALDLPSGERGPKLNYYRSWFRRTGIPLSMATRDLPALATAPVQAVSCLIFWVQYNLLGKGRRRAAESTAAASRIRALRNAPWGRGGPQ